jgi:hypothetical protein
MSQTERPTLALETPHLLHVDLVVDLTSSLCARDSRRLEQDMERVIAAIAVFDNPHIQLTLQPGGASPGARRASIR